jgi:hypothetical protein
MAGDELVHMTGDLGDGQLSEILGIRRAPGRGGKAPARPAFQARQVAGAEVVQRLVVPSRTRWMREMVDSGVPSLMVARVSPDCDAEVPS